MSGFLLLMLPCAFSAGDMPSDASRLKEIRGYDYSCVARGQVFVANSWLSGELLQALRSDLRRLNGIGALQDMDELLGKRLKVDLNTDDWTVSGESEPSEARAAVRRLIDALRVELEPIIRRRLFLDELGSQAKFTIGKVDEPVLRHTDQRHEALGTQMHGTSDEWTRRSIAWLLYLSEDDWEEPGGSGRGGTLRAFPRHDCVGAVGAHDGNQQVGWLDRGLGAEPIFLDSWVVPAWMAGRGLGDLRREWAAGYEDEGELWSALFEVQPSYQLYSVRGDGQRENVSPVHDAPSEGCAEDGDFVEHIPSLLEMLPSELRAGFSSTVDEHPMQRPVDVSPKGGTLVVFDTLAVPHEVSAVLEGERLLLFGFFAEERQVPSAWIDSCRSVCGDWFHDGRAHMDDMD